jgi:hypothetical protein
MLTLLLLLLPALLLLPPLLLLLQAVLEFKWETFAGGWVKFEFM